MGGGVFHFTSYIDNKYLSQAVLVTTRKINYKLNMKMCLRLALFDLCLLVLRTRRLVFVRVNIYTCFVCLLRLNYICSYIYIHIYILHCSFRSISRLQFVESPVEYFRSNNFFLFLFPFLVIRRYS